VQNNDNRRKSPRVKNDGIVKHAYIIFNANDEHENLLECEVVDVSQQGMKGSIKEPGNFRYNIEDNLLIHVRIIFNNDKILNLKGNIMWFKDSPDELIFGLYFSGSIW